MDYTLNVHGQLLDLSRPLVMGILNATPDSFYADSRRQTEGDIALCCSQMLSDGAAIIDVGGCSTRPGGEVASEDEEMKRLRMALGIIRREQPQAVVSVDTFRPDVARMAVEEFGADIINDVSGGTPEMFRMVTRLRVPYILMSLQPTMREMLLSFAEKVQQLRDMGANDIILDPGFGFGKTLEQNYEIMNELEKLLVMELPLLVGISRTPATGGHLKEIDDLSSVRLHASASPQRHNGPRYHRPDERCQYPPRSRCEGSDGMCKNRPATKLLNCKLSNCKLPRCYSNLE